MTIDQLQKPSVASKLITKFTLTPPVNDRRGTRRGRLTTAAAEPLGLAVTKTDDLVMTNAGDDSVLLYDLEGRPIRRVDQRQLLQTRVQPDNNNRDNYDERYPATAVVGRPDVKFVLYLCTYIV